jgi:glycerol-3-phosphate acyltransferase PlsY
MAEWQAILAASVLAFLLGSIPFGLLLTRIAGLGDIRQIGSGSIGATNVLRTGNKGLAAATVLLDLGKGALAVLLAEWIFPGTGGYAAVAAVAGHCFPPWLKFKGGKGFATAAGVCLVVVWQAFLICAVIWATALALSRISSVSSMSAVLTAPIASWLLGLDIAVLPMLAVAAIVIVQHRANIGRLLRGEEPKVGSKKA